ncbi:MAG: hypothetical protein IJP45_03060 [Paludibacteraceae bacterium]|nr:hypothetical protein [Paludibacteraceae bacterium]
MKTTKLFIFSVLAILFTACNTQEPVPNKQELNTYYWYQGEKIPLEQGNQQYIIFEDDLLKASDKQQLLESGDVTYHDAHNLKWGITKPNAVIEDTEHVLYCMHSFVGKHSDFFVTHRFYVKLKDNDGLSSLREMASKYNAEIEEEGVLDLWYVLRCRLNPQYNALELANIFYESGLFTATEPEFMGTIHFDAPTL